MSNVVMNRDTFHAHKRLVSDVAARLTNARDKTTNRQLVVRPLVVAEGRAKGHRDLQPALLRSDQRFLIASSVMLWTILLSGCSETTPSTKSYEIVHTVKKGSVEVNFQIDHRQITTAGRVAARLEVLAPADRLVHLPPADALLPTTSSSTAGRTQEQKGRQPADLARATGQDAQRFTLVDLVVSDDMVLRNGQVRRVETFLFEPFLPGDYVIPSLTISWSRRPPDQADASELKTEEIPIRVVSLLPPGEAMSDIKDIAPLADFPRFPWGWVIAGMLLGLVILSSGIWIVVRRQRSSAEHLEVTALAAHEIAFQELRQLLDEHLIEHGAIDPFYTRLSAILRHYLARRFGLQAPVQTSEEFLRTIRRRPSFARRYQETLGTFLTQCDLVKFARLRPEVGTIETAVHSCRQFIEETKEQDEKASGRQSP